jgi:small-conductance mechanosensitive channel
MKCIKFIYIIFLLFVPLFAQQLPDKSTTDSKANEEPVPIPITEVTSQADEARSKMKTFLMELEPVNLPGISEQEIPLMLDSLKRLRGKEIYKQLDEQEVRVLASLSQQWQIHFSDLNAWRTNLVAQSEKIQNLILDLSAKGDLWKITQKAAISAKAPKAIRGRISETINEIDDTRSKLSKRLNNLLILQESIAQSQSEVDDLTARISEAAKGQRNKLLVRDSPPLWELWQTGTDSLQISIQFQQSWSEILHSNTAFIESNIDRFYLHLIIFIFLIVITFYLYNRNKKELLFNEEDQVLRDSAYFVSRPFSAALLITLMLSLWIYPNRSTAFTEFIMLLMLLPVLRMVPGIVNKLLHRAVYILAALFFLDILQRNALGMLLFQRIILFFTTVTALIYLAWLMRPGSPVQQMALKGWVKIFRRMGSLSVVLLFLSLLGNFYGALNLAKTMTWGIVESSHAMVTLFITSRVASGLITVLIRRRGKRALQFVKTYAGKMESWIKWLINTIAVFIWLRATLSNFALLEPLQLIYTELLSLSWTIGNLVISLEVIFNFIIILIFTFLFTRIVRIFLDLEVFPHIPLPKGLPSAISMLVRYLLIGLGFFLAFSSLGIDLGKFGVLAGALGVGLGFGLQKIVANFISSLIIAFGRVIRVGDTVEYDNIFGNMKEIGVNASIVKTFDGSDVIIPNSDLISNKVTNWTLKEMQRRLMLPVKVAFGNDPREILKILEQVALDHPDVFKSPEPIAVFNGFGDNFLDFSLYYWIPTSLYFKLKTEVALAVHDAITERGIETPRPQRDLRLTMDRDANKLPLPEAMKSKNNTPAKKRTPKSKS